MKSANLTMFLCEDCMQQHVRDCSTLVDGTGSFSTKKYMEELKAAQQSDDIEEAHVNADGTLCNLLIDLGYKSIVEEYHKGHIFVKQSEIGIGTVFRIEIPKS